VRQLLPARATCTVPSTFSETRFTSDTSRRIASASSGVSEVVPCDPVRRPFTFREPASIQTKASPRSSRAWRARAAPASPIALAQTTAATPMVIPRVVRAERVR